MRNLLVMSVLLALSACNNKVSLPDQEAINIIREAKKYPKPFTIEINRVDPASAKRLLDAGLEDAGLITVDRTKKLKDIGNAIIHFSDKAAAFLLPTPTGKDPNDVQVVKIADEDVGTVNGIQMDNDGKSARVEYTTVCTNISPFSKLIKRDLSVPQQHTANFSIFDTGWKLDK